VSTISTGKKKIMALREIDLNIIPTEFEIDINQNSSLPLLQDSSSNNFLFDLNDDILLENDIEMGEFFREPNVNTGMCFFFNLVQ